MTSTNSITALLRGHYETTHRQHGDTSMGVDWGTNQENVISRHNAILEVVTPGTSGCSLLDVGCGYGSLLETIKTRNIDIAYTGIDVVGSMIASGKRKYPRQEWVNADFIHWTPSAKYDYVVANGILTQKLSASTLAMNKYAQALILKMFEVCRIGISFNLMSTFVNFQKDNLYYRCPAEMLAWCMAEVSPHARLNASYKPWYEYTVTLFRGINT